MSLDRDWRVSFDLSLTALSPIPFSPALVQWTKEQLGWSGHEAMVPIYEAHMWTWANVHDRWSVWFVSPELARQALVQFLAYWVERPLTTGGAFLIPRVLQRDWGHLSRHVVEWGTFLPYELPLACRFDSPIPFCLLVVSPHVRRLPDVRLDRDSPSGRVGWWHQLRKPLLFVILWVHIKVAKALRL